MYELIEGAVTDEIEVKEKPKPKVEKEKKPKLTDAEIQSRYQAFLKRGGK